VKNNATLEERCRSEENAALEGWKRKEKHCLGGLKKNVEETLFGYFYKEEVSLFNFKKFSLLLFYYQYNGLLVFFYCKITLIYYFHIKY